MPQLSPVRQASESPECIGVVRLDARAQFAQQRCLEWKRARMLEHGRDMLETEASG
jgi:hypothetical protein